MKKNLYEYQGNWNMSCNNQFMFSASNISLKKNLHEQNEETVRLFSCKFCTLQQAICEKRYWHIQLGLDIINAYFCKEEYTQLLPNSFCKLKYFHFQFPFFSHFIVPLCLAIYNGKIIVIIFWRGSNCDDELRITWH